MSTQPSTPKPQEQNQNRHPHQAPSRRPSLRTLAAAAVGLFVLLAGAAVCLKFRAPRAVTLALPGPSAQTAAAMRDRDRQLRRLAVGTWQDSYQGRRTLTLRPDGTATMVVELTGIKAHLFTPRLELDIAWSIDDGKMHRRTLGGRPADKVEFVNRRAGVAVAEPVLQLTQQRMILLDQNGSRKYTWRRVGT